MFNQNYPNEIIKQSQEKLVLMKKKMLAPIREIQQKRKESLRFLLKETEQKEQQIHTKKIVLEKLCQE